MVAHQYFSQSIMNHENTSQCAPRYDLALYTAHCLVGKVFIHWKCLAGMELAKAQALAQDTPIDEMVDFIQSTRENGMTRYALILARNFVTPEWINHEPAKEEWDIYMRAVAYLLEWCAGHESDKGFGITGLTYAALKVGLGDIYPSGIPKIDQFPHRQFEKTLSQFQEEEIDGVPWKDVIVQLHLDDGSRYVGRIIGWEADGSAVRFATKDAPEDYILIHVSHAESFRVTL